MNAALFLVIFLIASVIFEWLEGEVVPAAMVGHGFTWIDWMFLIVISSIGGPTLVIVFARVINWLQRRDKKARNIRNFRWTAHSSGRYPLQMVSFQTAHGTSPILANRSSR